MGGGVLECWSLDTDNPMRSRKYGTVVLDEAAFVRSLKDKWNKAIRPTLADLRGDAWFLSSPAGLGDFFDIWQRGQPGPHLRPNWMSWQMPTATNPYISQDEIEEARLDTPPLEFRQEWLGEFVTEAGIMFDTGLVHLGEAPVIVRRFLGIDPSASSEAPLGANGKKKHADDFAMACVGQDQAKRWWILDMDYGKWHPTQAMDRVFAFARKHEFTDGWMEMGPIGRSLLPFYRDEMARRGQYFPLHEVSHMGDKLAKAAPVAAACNARRLCVPYGASWWPDLRDEMARFNGLDGNPDDLVDAIGIPVRMCQRVYPDQAAVAPPPPPEARTKDWFAERIRAREAAKKPIGGGPRSRFRRK
jgi:predicted phage terminase large subunit-like protein